VDATPLRYRAYRLLIDGGRASFGTKVFDAFMVAIIFLSTGSVIAESVPSVARIYGHVIETVDFLTMGAITVEYATRLWACVDDNYFAKMGPWKGRLAYACSPMMVIDLVAFLPFYLALVSALDFRFLLVLRLLRILKVARYSPALASVMSAVVAERKALLAALYLLLVALVMVAGIMYHLEGEAQPEAFGTIPRAMWWAIITVTTVGYGDVTPITAAGKLFAGFSALLGIMVCAVPAGIMASSFIAEVRKRDFVVSCQLVAKVPSFRGLPADAIAEIASVLQSTVVGAHQVLIERGATAERIYFLVEGMVKVELPDMPVYLQRGEFFGERALLYNRPRQATIVTMEECRLLYLDREPFLELLRAHPSIREAIERVLEARFGAPPQAQGL
jgi:voltage-gated potassium channel